MIAEAVGPPGRNGAAGFLRQVAEGKGRGGRCACQ
jgi:hypothetical protein